MRMKMRSLTTASAPCATVVRPPPRARAPTPRSRRHGRRAMLQALSASPAASENRGVNSLSESIDLQINARWIIPVEPADTVLEHHAVAVRAGRIVAVLPRDDAHSRFHPEKTVELPEHILMPGLVNLHVHSAMSLMRGIADDLPLMRWLQEAIWPAEVKHMSPELRARRHAARSGRDASRAESHMQRDVFLSRRGRRANFSRRRNGARSWRTVLDFPTPYASDADDYLRKGLAGARQMAATTRASVFRSRRTPLTPSRTRRSPASRPSPRTRRRHPRPRSRRRHRRSPIQSPSMGYARLERLARLGHARLERHRRSRSPSRRSDIDILARSDASIAHCPTSNMKLASGIRADHRLARRGDQRQASATDGARKQQPPRHTPGDAYAACSRRFRRSMPRRSRLTPHFAWRR